MTYLTILTCAPIRLHCGVPGSALALVLGAALIHAAWNALAKRAQDQLVFLWSSVSLATVALAPVGFALLPAEGVSAAALPYLAATIAIHAVYFYALSRAYGAGDFSLVYPIARGLGVALVPVVAWALLDERLSTLGSVGVALVVAGIAAIGAGPVAPAARGRLVGAGTGWALVTGLSIAGYSVVDKVGVGRLHPAALHRHHGRGDEPAPRAGGVEPPRRARRGVARELARRRRRVHAEPHQLPARALRVPALEGGLRRGGAGDVDRPLGADRPSVARRGPDALAPRRRRRHPGRRRLRRPRLI